MKTPNIRRRKGALGWGASSKRRCALPRLRRLALEPLEERTLLDGQAPLHGTWTRLADAPGQDDGRVVVYDTAHDRAVLFSTSPWQDVPQSTWTWDGAMWTELVVSQHPPYRAFASQSEATYDSRDGRMLIYGGWRGDDFYYRDFWQFKDDQWTLIQDPAAPGRRHGHIVFDSDRNVTVLFGPTVGSILHQT